MSELLSYTEEGAGEPLVLIMGLGAEGHLWRPHVNAWAEHYRCILIDNRGIGRSSDDSGEHSIALLAEDVARLLDHLDVTSARVIGVSMGSAITQQLMLDRADLVSKAVLIATWSRVTPSVATIFETLELAAQKQDAALLRRILHTVTWTPAWTDAHAEETQEILADTTPMAFATIEKQAKACAAFEVADRVGSIAVPTLVTMGVDDLIIHPHLSRETAELIGADLIEYSTGHVHHFEEVEKFNNDILEWIA